MEEKQWHVADDNVEKKVIKRPRKCIQNQKKRWSPEKTKRSSVSFIFYVLKIWRIILSTRFKLRRKHSGCVRSMSNHWVSGRNQMAQSQSHRETGKRKCSKRREQIRSGWIRQEIDNWRLSSFGFLNLKRQSCRAFTSSSCEKSVRNGLIHLQKKYI